ncbi:MAG: response regulator [Hyphomicrobiaceae bacterium]
MSINQQFKNILVVDDEASVRELLRDCFEIEGFAVTEAVNGDEMNAILGQQPIDLITLDLNLGGENGFDLVRDIRATRNVPIVMITGKGDTIDRVVGLELGADDYIAKPFQLREVVARVRAVLRRYHCVPDAAPAPAAASDEKYAFDGFELNVAHRELKSGDGQLHPLTTSEFDLLLAFVRRPSRVLSRDNIMDILKGHDWSPTDRSIDALIVRLRRKIEPSPSTPTLIKTVRGVGYVFAADVESL